MDVWFWTFRQLSACTKRSARTSSQQPYASTTSSTCETSPTYSRWRIICTVEFQTMHSTNLKSFCLYRLICVQSKWTYKLITQNVEAKLIAFHLICWCSKFTVFVWWSECDVMVSWCAGHPLCPAGEYPLPHGPGSPVAPWELQSLLWQTDGGEGCGALQ